MNPTYVNRTELIQHFKLATQEEEEKEEERNEDIEFGEKSVVVQDDILKDETSETYDTDLSIDIKAVLPVIDEYNTLTRSMDYSKNYTYKLAQILDKNRINTQTHKQIHLCIFNIVERPRVPPTILYLLNKDSPTNIMYFPHFTTKNNIMDETTKNINIIFKDWTSKPQHKGFLENKTKSIYILRAKVFICFRKN